jgi:RNA polymerase sigma-70 factor (ECF subfamily)
MIRSQHGTDDWFQSLVGAELPVLYVRALRLTHDHDAAQDLVQDTLERAYRKRALFQPGTNLRGWLLCIMQRIRIGDHRRRAGAPPTLPLEAIGESSLPHPERSASSEVESHVVDELSVASIHQAIEALPSRLRQVVMMADVEETPYGAIAKVLEIPPGTVASRLFRGRRQLQRMLTEGARDTGRLAKAG